METGYYGNSYSGGVYSRYNHKNVSRKAEEIVNKFENMQMDSIEIVSTPSAERMQSPLPAEGGIHYPVPQQAPPAAVLQRQFSEFPLDQVC